MPFPDLKISEFSYINFKVLSISEKNEILREAHVSTVLSSRASAEACEMSPTETLPADQRLEEVFVQREIRVQICMTKGF